MRSDQLAIVVPACNSFQGRAFHLSRRIAVPTALDDPTMWVFVLIDAGSRPLRCGGSSEPHEIHNSHAPKGDLTPKWRLMGGESDREQKAVPWRSSERLGGFQLQKGSFSNAYDPTM